VSAPEKFLKGKLLLDGGQLLGSFFHRTVVLICEHNAEGAFRPRAQPFRRQQDRRSHRRRPAGHAQAIATVSRRPGAACRVEFSAHGQFHSRRQCFSKSDLGHSLDDLVEVGESFSAQKKVKMFAGYAGWSPGQLESEMKRKSWLTFPASLELVFETPPDQLWPKILKSKGGWKNKLLSQMPDDLSLN
jgi:putative transcriptional regulator